VIEFYKNSDQEWLKQRIIGTSICVILAFLVLFLRFFYLQIIKGEEYRVLSEKNSVRLVGIKAPRGLIFDRNKQLLVDNRPSFNLKIMPEDAKDIQDTVSRVSKIIKVPCEKLMKKISEARRRAFYRSITLQDDISREELAVIEANKFDLPGIFIEIEPARHYIYKRAAHLLGYLGEVNNAELLSGKYPNVKIGDTIGRYGIEKSFENSLQGKRGGKQVEVDANGRVIKVLKTVDPISGLNLKLSLDLDLQTVAEKMMEGRQGAVVAIDPNNGNVLVMVSVPGFDQNDFVGGISTKKWRALINDPAKPLINKTIQGEYPPASTYKVITSIAALEEKIVDIHTTVFCPGFFKYSGRPYRCWNKGGHGSIDVIEALSQSCDVYFYQMGDKIGVDTLAKYAIACGLNKATGIQLANERSGLIPTSSWKKDRFKEPWYHGETLSLAIGQGYNLVTPLQMAVLTAAVANGGTLYKPGIVSRIENSQGTIVSEIESEVTGILSISNNNLEIIRKGLFKTVQGSRGTARKIRQKHVTIAGKTGTAQVFGVKPGDNLKTDKLDFHLRDHAWFICYAPTEKPVIAIAVLVEHGGQGSAVAAPVAAAIVSRYIPETLPAKSIPDNLRDEMPDEMPGE
jgi:penicillin-binding protein 2